MSKDLWGDLPEPMTVRTPLAILNEQAELLKSKTDGLLIGRVDRQQKGVRFLIHFFIIAPSLGGYQVNVLQVSHEIGMYPAKVTPVMTPGQRVVSCDGDQAFMETVGEIFASEPIRGTIAKLLTHLAST